jgi:hypothetical protein
MASAGNMGRAFRASTSTARHEIIWAGPQFPARRAPNTARIDGPDLGRHGPIKPNLFNFFNLVRYRPYIVVIFGVYMVKKMLELFNIFNLVSYELYMFVIF